ncbi:Polysaccharide biosynthesis protein/methyltransferase, putative [Polymorphum gilvum SL003B-26A1]|uniref:Polysaccharide biosynthesis protein/methyltransferase, putative n=1 Tax=Polymorphum gilvum (strain LMG 25793 / CGMCC 1.9160 / SL003B-26A1) TaxID=991905 RepID=F2J5T5_POLGS|nr:Polysaccharide biosynthesis protein/methyltransferase, putative [Polymorphum gilvum SL003B-26A1]
MFQARMSSVRLPGKSMMPLAGAPLAARVVERASRATRPDVFILAIPDIDADDPLVEVARATGVELFRGPEADVLARFSMAAVAFELDYVVRIPADNPCPEPWVIDLTIDHHLRTGNDLTTSYPDVLNTGFPDGIGCEVYRADALHEAARAYTAPRHREHPHTCFYDHAERYRIGSPTCPERVRRPDIVLDVNTAAEFDRISRLYDDLYPRNAAFGIDDVIEWWDTRAGGKAAAKG